MKYIIGFVLGIAFVIVVESNVFMTARYGDIEVKVQGICRFIK